MTARIGYLRVSTAGQSIEAQRASLGGSFDNEFSDEGVSGSVLAAERPGFAKLLGFVREGDTVVVAAVDCLGRDAIDVQTCGALGSSGAESGSLLLLCCRRSRRWRRIGFLSDAKRAALLPVPVSKPQD
jgi:Resolvase, N terminal domain